MQNLTGSVLTGRFRLEALEYQNDLGDVYRGLDEKRNAPVSITVLRAAAAFDPSVLGFQRDNLTLQTLTHKNIIPFYGLYQDENISFLVERYTQGASLRDMLLERRGRTFSVRDSMVFLKALCTGLGYVHRFGLVHCSVKPANIYVDEDGGIALGGFGFSRVTESAMTATGLDGLPAYLAPEEIRREIVTPATDVYALGLTLYEILTGRHPFLGVMQEQMPDGSGEQVIRAHLYEQIPDPRTLNPDLQPGYAQVILTALARDPRDRYQNTQEMLEVACAVNGYNPDQVPDRYASSESLQDTLWNPPTEPDRPAGLAAAAAASQSGGWSSGPYSPAEDQSGSGYPPQSDGTMLVYPTGSQQPVYPQQADENRTMAVDGYSDPYGQPYDQSYPASPEYGPPGGYAPPPRKTNWIPVVAAGGAGLMLLVCGMLIALAALPSLRAMFTSADSSATPTATFTLPPTSAGIVASPVAPGHTQAPGGAMASDTPLPTLPPLPTETPVPPPPTPEPPTSAPPTQLPNFFTVTIRNNLSYPIYAFRNGVIMGTDPIPSGRYIWYKGIPLGMHVFVFCRDDQMFNCGEQRQVNVMEDLTITVP